MAGTDRNAALYYHPDGFDTARERLMGRQAAGEGFLRGFVRHGGQEELYCVAEREPAARAFTQAVQGWGHAGPVRWVPGADLRGAAAPGCLHLPGPGLGEMAWRRRRLGDAAFSLCGLTHTMSSAVAMDAAAGLLAAPVQPWDALVCTSRAVRGVVEKLLDMQAEHLRTRMGAYDFTLPRLETIPLGVDCAALSPTILKPHRERWRRKLGMDADHVAFLFLGRLSFHAKAHPLPMYLALERAAQESGKTLHLIQAGWFANTTIEDEFRQGAREFCPSVRMHFLDGRASDVRATVWAAADAFVSLSDNVQETFGMAPLEAMAAGLPVVASDWDGYRDIVRHDRDGFLAPTLLPPAGLGEDLAALHQSGTDSYDAYIGKACQYAAVDVDACAAACARLAADPDLRRTMGASGRERAKAHFDWAVVVRRHQDLWQELAGRRRAAGASRPGPVPHRPDPFALFGHYASGAPGPDWTARLLREDAAERLRALRKRPMVAYAEPSLPEQELAEALLAALNTEEKPVAEILEQVPEERRPAGLRCLVWLAKLHLASLAPKKRVARGGQVS
jgi:glycosyltransferase involved in cell wall biosynthesis